MLIRLLATLCLSLAMSTVQAEGLGGYDPVSYFTGVTPAKGLAAFTSAYRGEAYHFASAANRDAFAADPEKYLPQYGGYCAWAVAQGKLAPGDPLISRVVDGKLYLNVNRDIAARWERDIPGFIRSADSNWPKLKK